MMLSLVVPPRSPSDAECTGEIAVTPFADPTTLTTDFITQYNLSHADVFEPVKAEVSAALLDVRRMEMERLSTLVKKQATQTVRFVNVCASLCVFVLFCLLWRHRSIDARFLVCLVLMRLLCYAEQRRRRCRQGPSKRGGCVCVRPLHQQRSNA